jgi:hypothetical protein
VFGAATNDIMNKCSDLHVRFRASDQGAAKESKAELMIYLKNTAGETIASGCKWSQPFLPREWIEVEAVFDDEDEIVRLSGPGCRYEVWYKVGKFEEYIDEHVFGGSFHMLCVDYFSLLASDGPFSTSTRDYMQPNHDCPVCDKHNIYVEKHILDINFNILICAHIHLSI